MSNPTDVWFSEQAREITEFGNSLINIHRAHRLSAIKEEQQVNPDAEMIFGGFMGGDYIKGIVYDDYITSKLVRLWEYSNENKKEIVRQILKEQYFYNEKVDLDKILEIIGNQLFICRKKKIEREFFFVASVVGAVHDTQDTNIFGTRIKYPVNPYMDVDFLEILFSSKYSMINKDNSSRNQFKRFLQPMFQCEIINRLAPELSDIQFAKKGYYSVNEFLGNKLIYLIKRAYRLKFINKTFPENFPYALWMKNYCDNVTEDIHQTVAELFDIQRLKASIETGQHQTSEKYWHQFTNMINMNYIFKYFGVSNNEE